MRTFLFNILLVIPVILHWHISFMLVNGSLVWYTYIGCQILWSNPHLSSVHLWLLYSYQFEGFWYCHICLQNFKKITKHHLNYDLVWTNHNKNTFTQMVYPSLWVFRVDLSSARCLHLITHQNGHGIPDSDSIKKLNNQKSFIF